MCTPYHNFQEGHQVLEIISRQLLNIPQSQQAHQRVVSTTTTLPVQSSVNYWRAPDPSRAIVIQRQETTKGCQKRCQTNQTEWFENRGLKDVHGSILSVQVHCNRHQASDLSNNAGLAVESRWEACGTVQMLDTAYAFISSPPPPLNKKGSTQRVSGRGSQDGGMRRHPRMD